MNRLENRRFVLILIFIMVGVIFIFRLMYMQIFDTKWQERAAEITEYKITTYPTRGIVHDRNGKKLIANETYYDLMVIPAETKDIDSVAFCNMLGIEMSSYTKKLTKAKNYSYRVPSVFEKQISAEDFAKIAPELYRFPGFFEQRRALRTYPQKSGAHILGYLNEVNDKDIEKNPYYRSGDYIGRSGIEQYYEKELRGERGVKYLLKNAIGLETGQFKEGKYDTAAVSGTNIFISIDAELQAYGERLMQGKVGSIVAIEPETGEILAMVSAPNYDPNLLVGRNMGSNYMKLISDTLKPMINRPMEARYPPGSIFKVAQALIALEEGVIDVNTGFSCNKSLVGCHNHPSPSDVMKAIQFSCNPYFYKCAKRIINQNKSSSIFKDTEIGLAVWEKNMRSFGFGEKLPVDVEYTKRDILPSVAMYDKMHGEGRWAYSTIYSLSIGQGEVSLTPMQMANFAAILANRGYYIPPHFIKKIEDSKIPSIYKKKVFPSVDTTFYKFAVEGMRRVVQEAGGTARRARTEGITVCGKTGTSQNPFGEDHSVFIAFAPMEKPQIALSVYIENAGFGGTWAAPIASLMIEKYINGEVKDTTKEERIMNTTFEYNAK